MSGHSYAINQHGNIGLVQAVHYGDNVFYGNTDRPLTLKHVALETHKKVKSEWEEYRTCDWLLRENDFQLWEKLDREVSFLWIHGRPGCGKSTLMSRVIESIYHQFMEQGPETIHLLYFYVGFGDDQEKDTLYRKMLMTFWEQATNESNQQSINTFGNHSTIELIENKLHKFLTFSKRNVYLVIDALDQLPLDSQYQILNGLTALAQKLRNETDGSRLSVAISSRDCNGIDQLKTYRVFPIEVTAGRNKRDIEIYLQKCLESKSKLFQKRPDLGEKVFNHLSAKADGMFLWAGLQALNICRMEMESQVLNALRNLIPPQKLQDMYGVYAEGFESFQELIQQQIAQRTMALLAHSNGSMTKEVILVALSLGDHGEVDQGLYDDLTKDPTIIVRFCNHLVRINESLGVFQFCHRTVFEFFREYKLIIYNHRIADLCLSHLCSPKFSGGPQDDARWYSPGSLAVILQEHPFLPFASLKWAISMKESFEPETDLEKSHSKILGRLRILFDKESAVGRKGNLKLAFQVYLINLGKTMPGGVCHEHIVSYFSLVNFFDIFKKRGWFDPTRLDDDDLSPVHWAIRNEIDHQGATSTVKKLIEYGANINIGDKDGRAPLYYAAYCGNGEVTQLLLDNQVKLDLENKNKETALIAACRMHHEDVILRLVKAQADVKIRSSFGTALQAISLVGCCGCAEVILNRYGTSKLTEQDGPFGTSLHAAAFHGHSDLVKLLCSKRTNLLHATHATYGSTITAAATGFNPGLDPAPFLEIIQELVRNGVNVNDRSGAVGPALRAAAYHGSPELVRLLLDKGAKIRKAKGPMGTAYEAAEDRGHQEIKDILLARDENAAKYSGNHASSSQGRQEIQRKIFRATVKTRSTATINSLIHQFEKFFEKEIIKGETSFLRGLAKLGENAFQDVIMLATEPEDNCNTPPRRKRSSKSRFRQFIHHLRRMNFISKDDELVFDADHADGISPHLHRRATTFGQDGLREHLPQVLDRMTQAAVKILEDSITSKDEAVIRLIANTWVEALNTLVSYPGFGESMLEMVVQRRASELKGHFINPDLSPNERSEKSKALASVGIELLLMAIKRGQKFRHLSFVISKLWIKAVNDVEELGEEGQALIQELIDILSTRFSNVVMNHDRINADACAGAGVELLRAAALSLKTRLLDRLCKVWLDWWELALEKNMKYMIVELINQRWKEYQGCLKDNKYDEALGLTLTAIGVLRAAVRYRNEPAGLALQPFVELGFETVQETNAGNNKSAGLRARDLSTIFDALISLFAIAEEVQPGCLRTLATKILGLTKIASTSNYQELLAVIELRVEEVDKIVSSSDREKQLIQMSRTILMFIDVSLCAAEQNSGVLLVLKKIALENLATMLPNFIERGESVSYTRAIAYLKLEYH